MHPWQAFILGVIEGITEYLPVSSTGHLIVAQRLMGIGVGGPESKAAADAFAVCIQGGAILAVLGLYSKRVIQMIRGVLGQDAEGLRLAIAIIAGFLPAAVLGLLLNHWIEAKLFGMWPVIVAWIVGGVSVGLLCAGLVSPRVGALIQRHGGRPVPWLAEAMRWLGVVFLVVYGGLRFRAALRGGEALMPASEAKASVGAVLATCVVFTWANPHVYLDTVVLVGSIASQHKPYEWAFGFGAATASLTFFATLGYGARLLAPLFAKPKAWVVLEVVVGVTMWAIAAGLVLS